MAEYVDVIEAVERHQTYPALDQDLKDHAFQRHRVGSCAAFVRPGDVVLDVACNTGYYKTYVPQAAEVHGVDASVALVEVAKSRLDSARVAAAENLPFPDRAFDVVNVGGLLEQVFDPVVVIREAARVSRRLVTGNTTHSAGTWGKHRIARHEWQSYSYTEAELRAVLEPVGQVVVLGTVDVIGATGQPEPQCWYFCVRVEGATV